ASMAMMVGAEGRRAARLKSRGVSSIEQVAALLIRARRHAFTSFAVTAMVAAGIAQPSAFGATSPYWGDKPTLLVDQVIDVLPEVDVNLLFAAGSAPGRVTLYIPAGFDVYPQRSAGSIVGSALVY